MKCHRMTPYCISTIIMLEGKLVFHGQANMVEGRVGLGGGGVDMEQLCINSFV